MKKQIVELGEAYERLQSAESNLAVSVMERSAARINYRIAKEALVDIEQEMRRV